MIFDHEEVWLSRPENPRPFTDADRDRRRKLLGAMGDQFASYLAVIEAEDRKIQNDVSRQNAKDRKIRNKAARQNPVVID